MTIQYERMILLVNLSDWKEFGSSKSVWISSGDLSVSGLVMIYAWTSEVIWCCIMLIACSWYSLCRRNRKSHCIDKILDRLEVWESAFYRYFPAHNSNKGSIHTSMPQSSKAVARGRGKARLHRGGKDRTIYTDSSRDYGRPISIINDEDQDDQGHGDPLLYT